MLVLAIHAVHLHQLQPELIVSRPVGELYRVLQLSEHFRLFKGLNPSLQQPIEAV